MKLFIQNIYYATKVAWFVFMISAFLLLGKGVVNYVIDTQLPASNWLHYESIDPSPQQVIIGNSFNWHTKAVRFKQTDQEYYDELVCIYNDAPKTPVTLAPAVMAKRLAAKPAYVGNVSMHAKADRDYLVLSGVWQWTGGVPTRPARCYLEAQVKLRPSPFVEKVIRFRSTEVEFIYPPEKN